MKKNIILKLLFMSIMLLCSSDVLAKTDLFTCDYNKITWFPDNNIYGKISVVVYDDKTVSLLHNGTTYDKATQFKFKIGNNEYDMEITDEIYEFFYKQAVDTNNKYSCPSLNVQTIVSNVYNIGLAEGKATDPSSSWNFEGSITNLNDDNKNNAVNVTKECKISHSHKDGGLPGYSYDLVLKMFSNGKKQICFLPLTSGSNTIISSNCSYVNSNEDTLIMYNNENFVIKKENHSAFFPQNTSQEKANTFSCPSQDVYIGVSGSGYQFTFNKKDLDGFDSNIGKPKDDSDAKSDDNNDSDQEVERCEVLPEAIKNYIMQALKLIRWGGLVLMIVLGTLDFVKASAADDQDALKKAGQNFIKRLIAVIILFLLPLLVELILFIAGKIGFNFGECYSVSEF